MLKKIETRAILFVMIIALSIGCSVKTEQDSAVNQTKKSAAMRSLAIKTAETITPEDTLTTPEEGGYGFEDIAEDLGYQTYIVPESDYKFFGDPRAIKGEQITRVMPRFPATMRAIGQHSNYTEAYMFNGMIFEPMLDWHPVTLEFMPILPSHWKI